MAPALVVVVVVVAAAAVVVGREAELGGGHVDGRSGGHQRLVGLDSSPHRPDPMFMTWANVVNILET